MALLVADEDGWSLAIPGQASEHLVPSAASMEQLAEALVRVHPHDAQLGVLLDSRRVFQASFSAEEVGGKHNPDATAYRLEAELPFSAEDLITDSIHNDNDLSVFAINKEETNDLLSALAHASQGAGVSYGVRFITPSSMVLSQAFVESKAVDGDVQLVLPAARRSVELIRVRSRVPLTWKLIREDASPAEWNFAAPETELFPVVAVDEAMATAERVYPACRSLAINRATVLHDFGHQLVANRQQPWVNFMRGRGVVGRTEGLRESNQRLLLVVSLSLLVIALGFFFRSYQLGQASAQARALQTEVFQTTFPGQRKPAAVLKRLKSEYARVRGSRSSNEEVPAPQEALPVLGNIVEKLPKDVPAELTEIRIEDGQVYLDLKVQKHEDATRIVEGLSGPEFEFSPPTTEATDSAVVALIRGRAVERSP